MWGIHSKRYLAAEQRQDVVKTLSSPLLSLPRETKQLLLPLPLKIARLSRGSERSGEPHMKRKADRPEVECGEYTAKDI
jgi:hypothetical protein